MVEDDIEIRTIAPLIPIRRIGEDELIQYRRRHSHSMPELHGIVHVPEVRQPNFSIAHYTEQTSSVRVMIQDLRRGGICFHRKGSSCRSRSDTLCRSALAFTRV